MDQAKPEGKSKDPVQAEYEEGKRMIDNGRYGEAAVALHNALLGFEEKNDETGIANASNQLGRLCLAKEDYAGADKHYNRARELCEKFDDPMSLFALSKAFIEVHSGLKEYGKAIECCLDVLDMYQLNNDPRGAVTVLERMAEVYVSAGEKEKAADTYRTVASIHRNFKHATTAESFEKKADELAADAS
jgi:tetratricopeptide (TPR) repeat protein